jgi:two-component system, NarL family, sensor kinase
MDWFRGIPRSAANITAKLTIPVIAICPLGMTMNHRYGSHGIWITVGSLLILCMAAWTVSTVTRAVTRSTSPLQLALRKATLAKQAERQRIARELHDGICQMLIAVRHSLELAAEHRALTSNEFDTFFARGMKQLHDAILETRRVSHDLKSVMLTDQEFTDAWASLGREFAERTQIQVDFASIDTTVDNRLSVRAKSALLRITQEALANIQKHSGASCVKLTLENQSRHVELRVADNGCGFESPLAHTASQTGGIGIDNMRERAVALGGSLSLHSTGRCTEVIARLPVPDSHSRRAEAI